jgi:hypothetical protein
MSPILPPHRRIRWRQPGRARQPPVAGSEIETSNATHFSGLGGGGGFPRRLGGVSAVTHPDDDLPFNQEDLRDPDMACLVEEFLLDYPKEMIDKLLEAGQPLP